MAPFSFSPRLSSLLICGALAASLAQPSLAQTVAESSLRAEPEPQVIHASTVLQSAQAGDALLSADSAGIANRLKSNAITSGPRSYATYPATNVGTTSSSYITFSTTFSASTTVTGDGVYTLGASGSDFQNVGTGSCDTNGFPYTYAANATCTTNVSFTPTKPGNRMGAEVLYTSTAGSYYYGYVNGIGNGPQVTFATATPALTTLASGLSAYNSALDGAGDLWVTDAVAGAVKEFVPTGGVYPTSPTNTFTTGFSTPEGIAIDGLGNVFVGDSGKGYILRLTATNGTVPAGTVPANYVTFTSAGTQPFFVALDPTDTYLYFIAIYSGSNYLIECAITTGNCALITTFTAPRGFAVDSAGYKYISENTAGTIIQLPTVYNSTTKTTLLSGLTLPTGLAADAAGDLYVTAQNAGTSGAGTVTEYLATSGLVSSSSSTRTVATGLFAPNGVAVDSSGNVFIADTSNTAVKKVDFTDAPKIAFADTTVGNTSSAATVTLQNIGNTALSFTAPSSGVNPSLPSQFALSAYTCPDVAAGGTAGTLAYGATCTYSLAYSPTATGALVGFFTLTDNNLNVASATQTVRLTGSTGGLSMTVAAVSAAKGSTAVPLEVLIGYGGNTTPTGVPAITVNGSSTGVGMVTCSGKAGHLNCSATYNASSLAGGQYTIKAQQPASGPYTATSATGLLSITGSSLRLPSPINTVSPPAKSASLSRSPSLN